MINKWSLQNAKSRFSELVNLCLENGPQMVTRNGRETVVVISAEAYKQTIESNGSLKDFLLSAPRVDLSIDRSEDAGRQVEL